MSLIGIRNKTTKVMQYFEEKEFGKDKKEEDLHDLIKKNPKLIFEDICDGEPILLGSEITLPSGKQPDLIFCDSDGTIFIVELKRDRTPREAIAQLLDYASSMEQLAVDKFLELVGKNLEDVRTGFCTITSGGSIDASSCPQDEELKKSLQSGLENPQLLLVSYEIPDDIRRIASFLRSKDILINCVEFDYYIDEKNNEIFVPNLIEFEETKEIRNKTMSQLQRHYFEFFSSVVEKFKEKKPMAPEIKGSAGDYWRFISLGYSGCHLEWVLRGGTRHKHLQVALHLESNDKNKNHLILKELENRKEELSKNLESTNLDFRSTNWCGMVELNHPEEFDVNRLAENAKLKDWAVDTMIKFYGVFIERGLFETVVSEVEGDADERGK